MMTHFHRNNISNADESTFDMNNDLDLKFLIIGDSNVGKTSLLTRYIDDQYTENLAPTVGVDIRDKTIPYKSSKTNKSFNVHLQLWDTAGQERFRSLTASFFRDAIGFILVFDLSNEESFLNVRNWIGEIQNNAYSDNIDMILVGNKSDLEKERIITKSRAVEFAAQNQIEYIETSALLNRNVAESVNLLLEAVMDRLTQSGDPSSATKRNRHVFKQTIKIEDIEKKNDPKKVSCCWHFY